MLESRFDMIYVQGREKKELGAVLGIVFCCRGVYLLEDIFLPCSSGD